MRSSKLVATLKTLTKKQLPPFWDFVSSPYFNKSQKVKQLYQYIKAYGPEYASGKLTKELAFVHIYPDESYNEKKITNLMNNLLDLLEEFIIHDSLKKDHPQQLRYLLQSYINLNLDKHYKQSLKRYRALVDNQDWSSGEYYKELFQLNYFELMHSARQPKRAFEESLQQVADNLDKYYLVEKLRLCCEMISRKSIIASDYKLRLLDEIKTYLNSNQMENVPALQVYRQIIALLENEDDVEEFDNLRALLDQNSDKFSRDEARQMYFYAVNYCIRKFNKGALNFLKELFELNKILLDKRLLLVNGLLPPWRFKNVATVAIKAEQFDWTKRFIDEYKELLPADAKEEILKYNLANLHYAQKEYDMAMQYLRDVESEDAFLNIDSKSLLMMIYYEKGEMEALYNLLDSFRMYLRRNKILSEYHKQVRLNFIKFVKKLMKLLPGQNKQLEALKAEVAQMEQVESKEWIYQMIDLKTN